MTRRKSSHPSKKATESSHLPNVLVVEVVGVDDDGDPLARPIEWKGREAPPTIVLRERRGRKGAPNRALGPGDRALVRMQGRREASVMKRIAPSPRTVIGVFDGQRLVRSTERSGVADYLVVDGDAADAEAGELVLAEIVSRRRLERPRARVLERLGAREGPRAFSFVAIRNNDIPHVFDPAAVDEAEAARPVSPDDRADLRDVPLVTIDGADARDFDDAVWAEREADEGGRPGWHLIVAIADVAWYVRPGSALDAEAYRRGNSVYFPDRVVPMLPEALSNGLCSLRPDEDRACIAAHIWIDDGGNIQRHRFERAIMRSVRRLTYAEVQKARDAKRSKLASIVTPLYGAFDALMRARTRRDTLDLEIPERHVTIDKDGHVTDVAPYERLDSHKLIEEFMITANVAAAETLERVKQPCMYRVHDSPPGDKIDAFAEFMREAGIKFAKGQVIRPATFNRLLENAEALGIAEVIHDVVLRTQAQAEYSVENIGHFGLALRRYAHFTSPIRRYADLLVHRALISGLKLGPGGLPSARLDWKEIGQALTAAERRAVAAEREADDRFVAAYYADRIGELVEGRIAGESRSGLFVRLSDSRADGFVPRRYVPGRRPERSKSRRGQGKGGQGRGGHGKGHEAQRGFEMGDPVRCRILEADGLRGSLVLEIVED